MRGFGGVLSFGLEGGFEAVRRVLPRLRLAHRAANLGAVETIAGPPATTSHVECTVEERAAMGIPEGLIRYSVGIEDPTTSSPTSPRPSRPTDVGGGAALRLARLSRLERRSLDLKGKSLATKVMALLAYDGAKPMRSGKPKSRPRSRVEGVRQPGQGDGADDGPAIVTWPPAS
jgi:hypothetical protein